MTFLILPGELGGGAGILSNCFRFERLELDEELAERACILRDNSLCSLLSEPGVPGVLVPRKDNVFLDSE